MNNKRRKQIGAVRVAIEEAKAKLNIEDIIAQIEEIRDEEQDSFDNMPENLQQSEKGQASETAIQALSDACDNLQSLLDNLDFETVISSLDEAESV